MRFLAKAIVIGMGLCPCLTAKVAYPVACSAFDQRGDAARVTLAGQTLNLKIVPASSGKPFTLVVSTNDDGLIGCSVFFDAESHFVAVGVDHLGLKSGPLRVLAADLSSNQIISDFALRPDTGFGTSLKLVGFLKRGRTLVVLGSAKPDHPTKTFTTTLFDVRGKQEHPPELRTLPAGAGNVGNPKFADARHNRLWFKSSPQFCPLRYVLLARNGSDGDPADGVDMTAVCDVGSAIAYPSEDTIIAAVSRDTNDLVTRVDLVRQTVEQIPLSSAGPGVYSSIGRAALSPDGQVFAVTRKLLKNSPIGDAENLGMEIEIVQVSPLKIIGKVRCKQDTDIASLSVNHQDAVVTVVTFADGKWAAESVHQ